MSNQWTPAQMRQRLVRYTELRPCRNAFVDTYTPGSDQKENFTIIGPGVAEHPDQHVHIKKAHGFNIGGARQPPRCVNSQHSHTTEEVFIVHSGRWAFRLGEHGEAGEVVLEPGDCISIPVDVFRGFENIGDDVGYLFAVLGSDDPGHVLWAPDVFVKATEYGLILLENGRLVDTTKGETVPEGIRPMEPTTPAQVAALRNLSQADILTCVCAADQQREHAGSTLTETTTGVVESAIIGPANTAENIAAGKMPWAHGFNVRRLDMETSTRLHFHARQEEEVVYVHRGEVVFQWADGEFSLAEGDVLTVPIGLMHAYVNNGSAPLIAYVVRGGDQPAPLIWRHGDSTAAMN